MLRWSTYTIISACRLNLQEKHGKYVQSWLIVGFLTMFFAIDEPLLSDHSMWVREARDVMWGYSSGRHVSTRSHRITSRVLQTRRQQSLSGLPIKLILSLWSVIAQRSTFEPYKVKLIDLIPSVIRIIILVYLTDLCSAWYSCWNWLFYTKIKLRLVYIK